MKPNETMAINKFQRSGLTFNFSAKVAHIGVPSTHENLESSETTGPIEFKFHMKTPYDRLAKNYTNCTRHVTKMATTPICSVFVKRWQPAKIATYFAFCACYFDRLVHKNIL